jgi:peptide/nickel transport system substrate-binding protein
VRPERNRTARISLPVIAGVIAIAVLAGCSSAPQSAASTDKSGGTFVIANSEPPTAGNWDPEASNGLANSQETSLVFDTLLAYKSNGSIGSSLATKFDQVSDTKVVLSLRSDVKFSNGTPLTSADVQASLQRLCTPGSTLAYTSMMPADCTVTADSPTQVTITSPAPYAPLERSLAVIPIAPKADIDHPANWTTRPLGSGPYTFVSYSQNNLTLKANPNYWGAKPDISEIVLRYIADPTALQNAFLSGQVQMITRVGPDQLKSIKGNPAYDTTNVTPASSLTLFYQGKGKLSNVNVRQAVSLAVDRTSIAKNLLEGSDPVSKNALPTSLKPFYKASATSFDYDPAKAKQLLTAAGYPNGLTLTMADSTLFPKQQEIDQAVVADLKKVGITVKMTTMDTATYGSTVFSYDLGVVSFVSFNDDPAGLLNQYVGAASISHSGVVDPHADALVAASSEAIGQSRTAAVQAASDYLWTQQTVQWLADNVEYTAYSSKLKNYVPLPLSGVPSLAKASFSG